LSPPIALRPVLAALLEMVTPVPQVQRAHAVAISRRYGRAVERADLRKRVGFVVNRGPRLRT
jgi:hypothetical protein